MEMSGVYGRYELSEWSLKEKEVFENAAAMFGLGTKLFYENVVQSLPGKSMEDIRHKGKSLIELQGVPRADGDPMRPNNINIIGQRESGTGSKQAARMDQIDDQERLQVHAQPSSSSSSSSSSSRRSLIACSTDPNYHQRVLSMRRRVHMLGRGHRFGMGSGVRDQRNELRFGRSGVLGYPRKLAATKVIPSQSIQTVPPVQACDINIDEIMIPTPPPPNDHHVQVTDVMMKNMTIRDQCLSPPS